MQLIRDSMEIKVLLCIFFVDLFIDYFAWFVARFLNNLTRLHFMRLKLLPYLQQTLKIISHLCLRNSEKLLRFPMRNEINWCQVRMCAKNVLGASLTWNLWKIRYKYDYSLFGLCVVLLKNSQV